MEREDEEQGAEDAGADDERAHEQPGTQSTELEARRSDGEVLGLFEI